MPVVLGVLEVDVVDVALVAGVMCTVLGVVDAVVVVDVVVVHGCVSAKRHIA